jgi:hypothetical protein
MAKKEEIKLTLKIAFDVEEEDKYYYVRTDPMQYPRQLTSIYFDLGSKTIKYGLIKHDEEEAFWYEREISDTENLMFRQKYVNE